MDQKAIAFAHGWSTRYVRTKHPYGLDVEDVENRILESLYYNKDKEKALSAALNDIQNESRRNLRALCPWQVRNAEPHLETQAYRNLASDMHRLCIRQHGVIAQEPGHPFAVGFVVLAEQKKDSHSRTSNAFIHVENYSICRRGSTRWLDKTALG